MVLAAADPSDRAGQDGDVVGGDVDRTAVDGAEAADLAVGGRLVARLRQVAGGEEPELLEAALVEEDGEALAGVQAPRGALALQLLGAAHGQGLVAAPGELLQTVDVSRLVAHATSGYHPAGAADTSAAR